MSNYFEKMLGVVSPAYGALTGEGPFGNLVGKKSENETEAQKVLKDAADTAAKKQAAAQQLANRPAMKKGGAVKVSSASTRADGIAQRGKTKGTMVTMCGGGMYKK